MNKKEIDFFIEEMEHCGDEWTPEQVEDVYGDKTLQEALDERKTSLGILGDIFGKLFGSR